MADLALYLVLAVAGYAIASKLRGMEDRLRFIGPLQTLTILALVISMGARMGSNEEIILNLNKIGLYSFIFTVIVLLFSILTVSLTRRALGIDRYGDVKTATGDTAKVIESKEENSAESGEESKQHSMTLPILITVSIGMAGGYLLTMNKILDYDTLNETAGLVIKCGLCLLLFLVGMDLGLEGTFVRDIKLAGLRVFAIPVAIAVGTFIASGICSLFLPLSLGQALSVGAGFGWYSMAPVMIMEKGYITVSAISFMHNVMRELFALLLIPSVAKKIGYIEAVGMPGSGASDVCLPLIVKSTKGSVAIYSFVTGISISTLVPVCVPLFLG